MSTKYNPNGGTKRQVAYSKAGEMVTMVGEHSFGVEVSEPQVAYWDAIFNSVVYLDDILDGPASQRERLDEFQRAIDVITTGELDPTLDENGQKLLINIRETALALNPSKLPDIAKHAHTIALLGERARVTTDVHALGVLALAEGRETSRLVLVDQSATTTDPTKFNDYLQFGSAYANLLDSLIDLNKDYRGGLIALHATRGDRIELLKMFLPGGVDSVKKLKPSQSLFFAAKAVQTALTKHSKI